MIIETLENDPVGLVIVDVSPRADQSMATLSIAIGAERQDAGLGRDALSALIAALFDDWRIHRIQMSCEEGNERAVHLYESIGFTREATRIGATWTGGAFRDQHIYGLLVTDQLPEDGES
jgi:RimJ/RimL family protein N-acetyltransferase